MDWTDIGRTIAPLAPMLGGILGGFIPIPGGAIAGQAVGGLIARAFGVQPTPDAVHAAINANPNEVVLAKLTQATEMARVEVAGFADVEKTYLHAIEVGLAQTGASMRDEQVTLRTGQEHWFFNGWRPLAGWELDVFIGAFGILLVYALAAAVVFGAPASLATIKDAWPPYAAFLAVIALVNGINIITRGGEQRELIRQGVLPSRITIDPPPPARPASPIKSVIAAVRGQPPTPDRHGPV